MLWCFGSKYKHSTLSEYPNAELLTCLIIAIRPVGQDQRSWLTEFRFGKLEMRRCVGWLGPTIYPQFNSRKRQVGDESNGRQ